MRTLFAVGKMGAVRKVAERCFGCRRWLTREDFVAAHRDGARVSECLCDSCAKLNCTSPFGTTPGPRAA